MGSLSRNEIYDLLQKGTPRVCVRGGGGINTRTAYYPLQGTRPSKEIER